MPTFIFHAGQDTFHKGSGSSFNGSDCPDFSCKAFADQFQELAAGEQSVPVLFNCKGNADEAFYGLCINIVALGIKDIHVPEKVVCCSI